MNNEKSYLQFYTESELDYFGLTKENQIEIAFLIDKARRENLYTNTKDFQHDIKHIERVLAYTKMIVNKRETSIDQSLLAIATLYHDIGKTIGASNKEHGEVGAKAFHTIMDGIYSEKQVDTICRIIKTHATESDEVDFSGYDYSEEEKEAIQEMSDILKDADALDRNRLNYPPPIGSCDINRLRTDEAKEILSMTDAFYQLYCEKMIQSKEFESGTKIMNNYELLDQWIASYQNGEENMFHASLNPGIEKLEPSQSTQKGSYVYAGTNPVNCFSMAAFRFSGMFPRGSVGNVHAVLEIFPGSVDATLDQKYITIYKLPNEYFHQYIAPSTSAPSGEWVSDHEVKPAAQVSFPALDLVRYFEDRDLFKVGEKHTKDDQFSSLLKSYEMYIWQIKDIKANPKAMENNWKAKKLMMDYYNVDNETIQTMLFIKEDIDDRTHQYIDAFKQEHGREPNYDNELECVTPLVKQFKETYFKEEEVKGNDGIKVRSVVNYDYIDQLVKKKKQENRNNDSILENKDASLMNVQEHNGPKMKI